MLIFHEGLPGSGKSYEAVVKHILPVLKSGRCVYARVDGLDRESCRSKIAELIEVRTQDLDSLLFYVSPGDVYRLFEIVPPKAFVVIDEIARYWSATGKRKSMSEQMADFLKEHRHQDIDILAMDQDLRDVSPLWRRRVDRKIVFTKLDMLGAKNSYKWQMFKALEGEKFELVGKGAGNYDKKYFGAYASHISDDIEGAVYKDERAIIWQRPAFKYGIPIVFSVIIFCVWYIVRLFDPNSSALVNNVPSVSPVATRSVIPVNQNPVSLPVSKLNDVAPSQPKKPNPDYVKSFIDAGNRIRLVSVISSPGRQPYVVIEFRDDALRVRERLDSYMLQSLGWYVSVVSLKLVKVKKLGEVDMIATAWPIEVDSRISAAQRDDIRKQGASNSNQGKEQGKAVQNELSVYRDSLESDKIDAQQYLTLDRLQWVKGPVFR